MIPTSNHLNFHLQSPCFSSTTLPLIQFREFRVWRRRRLKKLTVSCQLAPFENLFQSLISVNSLEFIAPALGLASGAALYLSRSKSNQNDEVSDLGEWILVTSPTPFNRFVLLRCPSIMVEGSELFEDLNEKLVKEDRHFVKLISGKIQGKDLDGKNDDFEQNLIYQRTCVSTDDGGVISLDWPAKLDLREEHGMDTTVLLIPGTTEGSMSKNIRSFVCECLKRGCFPVVMNPRGCAGSPLTTARLFTAADSDDICTAIQFINRARPWNTLMAVGWGQGANMLTKYLAEVEERTPLTAATCIDNPFDLEEATRSSPYHVAVDQNLRSGLIDILRSNKELFQGRAKRFNVEKALSATSLRDFEREISMVSYGFESIEEFYSKSSTRELVGNVKIPLLFIQQSDDGTVPPFSIPRNSVAENPFTSMLQCSYLLSTALASKKCVLPWCQHFAIEWLTAVELGLLKGRHPLLKDVDVTINPSAGLALGESRASSEDSGVNNILNVTEMDALNGYPVGSVENDTADNVHLGSQRNISESAESQQGENHEMLEQSGSEDTVLVDEAGENSADNERSQVLQSAEVVMNMLDVTMPGTLQEEQKKKVLIAMEQGETLMKALEGALPEDVRGKLTTSVAEIVKTQGNKLNLRGIMDVSLVPIASSEVKSKVQETFKELSSAVVDFTVVSSPEQMKLGDEISAGTDKNEWAMENPPPEPEPESDIQPAQALQKSLGDSGDIPSPGPKEANESEQIQVKEEFSGQRAAQSSGYDESGTGTDSNLSNHSTIEKAGDPDSVVGDQDKVNQDNDITQMSTKEADGIKMNAETNVDDSNDKNNPSYTTEKEESLSPVTSSPEPPLMEEEMNNNQNDEDKNMQPMEDQDKQGPSKSEEPAPSPAPTSSDPSFNVSQALDALTGFDDSTQVAVNSVFGVLENMIAKLEEEGGQEIDGKQDKSKDKEPSSASEESPVVSETEDMPRNKENNKSGLSLESDQLQYRHPVNNSDKSLDLHQDAQNNWDEKQLTQSYSTSLEKNSGNSTGSSLSSHVDNEKDKRMDVMIDSTLCAKTSNKVGHICKLPLCITAVNPYGDSMYNEYLRRRLLSEMPNSKSLDLNSTADLLLDYFPEEGQWKFLDQTENNRDPDDVIGTQTINGRSQVLHSPPHDSDTNEIIETSYVILDTGKEQQPIREYKTEKGLAKKQEEGVPRSELDSSVKSIILDSLKVEVGRRLGLPDLKEMESNLALDLEHVTEVVSLAVGSRIELTRSPANESASGEVGRLLGEEIIQTISLAVNDSVYLKKVLPVGVIVGSILAALKKYFSVAIQHDNAYRRGTFLDHANNVGMKLNGHVSEIGTHKVIPRNSDIDSSIKAIEKSESANNDTVMIGAVTAALGASALFAHQRSKHPYNCDESVHVSSGSCNENGNHPKEHDNILDGEAEKDQNHVVSSLAEKAMSVAGPVVPTKSDGGLDQERLVAMLSDLGQKGGMLRMIGKLALLWGGIRGAVSLTDRLISFLRIADRPLFQRLLGFACMVLVLWSPVVIPLFPTLVKGWATHNSSGIAEYACLIGLYTAVTILVILWGKRIRGYKDPLEQYGLDLTSTAKLVDFSKGLMGGFMLVILIHSINALLGCAHFSWASGLPSSSPHTVALLKACGRLLMLAGRGIVTATFVVIVEEILFRSWLPQEISVDFGYHQAVIISGFAFSIAQRSLRSIPGLWLISIALSGMRQRSGGSLSIPIGMRAGILSSSFILQTCGFLTYHSSCPLWLTGTHPLQPFDGAVGLAFCIMLAMLLYPKQPLGTKKIQRVIRE